jgi:hypothetical protein
MATGTILPLPPFPLISSSLLLSSPLLQVLLSQVRPRLVIFSHLHRALDGEDLYDSYKLLQFYTEIPNSLRPWVIWLLNLSGETRKAKLVEATASGGLSVRQYWERIADRNEAVKVRAVENRSAESSVGLDRFF